MKYQVGDKVRIKSLDWYNENKNKRGFICFDDTRFISEMSRYCGEILTINRVMEEFEHYFMSECAFTWTDEMIEGLVERNGKTYPYKIGDRVVLKGNNRCATITDLKYNSWGNLSYYIKIDNDKDISIDYPTDLLLPYDNKIEGLVEEELNKEIERFQNLYDDIMETQRMKSVELITEKVFICPEGYEFRDENGNVINATKIVLEKKKKEYPKTYAECLKILGFTTVYTPKVEPMFDYDDDIIALQKLKNCRNAYWKIAGEEMGLGRSWEPINGKGEKVYSIVRACGTIKKNSICDFSNCYILEFPTEEMRDAFYENFEEEMENCKKLL